MPTVCVTKSTVPVQEREREGKKIKMGGDGGREERPGGGGVVKRRSSDSW